MLKFSNYDSEVAKLKERMNKILEKSVETLYGAEWSPDIDILENKDEIIVKADIPGVNANEIDLTITGDVLQIRGNRKQESEREDENYHFIGRNYGEFEKGIPLPVRINTDDIKASYKDGVLTVRLPKLEKKNLDEFKIQIE